MFIWLRLVEHQHVFMGDPKMCHTKVDDRHFLNTKIAVCPKPFDRISIKFGTMVHIGP